MATRVIVRRSLDQADQQRDVLGGQRIEVAAEPELGAGGDAMDGLVAALAQVDLVEVGLEDGALVIARFHDQCVQHLIELARDRLFLADPQQAAAGQLLGQRGGALTGLAAGTHQHPHRTGDAAEVDAMVAAEVLVLHRLQTGDQQVGGLVGADQAAFLLALAVQGGDARRIQPRGLERGVAVGIAQAGNAATGQADLHAARRHATIDVDIAAAGNDETAAVDRVGGRGLADAVVAVGRGGQLGLQVGRIHRHARGQHQRARIHPGRHLPAQLTETLGDLLVQVQGVRDQEAQSQCHRGHAPGDEAATPQRPAAVVVIHLVGIVGIVASRHKRFER